MKLYWRIKKNGKWTWKPAFAELCVYEEESFWKVKEEEE
jgi:hypothetical protein